MSDLPPDNIQDNNQITGNAWRNISDFWKINSLYLIVFALITDTCTDWERKYFPFLTSGFLIVPSVWRSYMIHKYIELYINQIIWNN